MNLLTKIKISRNYYIIFIKSQFITIITIYYIMNSFVLNPLL